jgi:hypothetical protein
MRFINVFLFLLLMSLHASVIAQEELSAFDQERLKLQQLQSEMLETRLALLEKRLSLLTEGEERVSVTEVEHLKYQVVVMRDSIRLLNKVLLELWHDYYRPVEPQIVVPQRVPREKPTVGFTMGLQAVRLFQGSFDFGFERVLNRHWTGELAISATWVSRYGFGSNYLMEQDFSFYDPMLSENVSYTGQMLRGFGVRLTPKNYLYKTQDTINQAPFGLYAAPVLEYRYFRITGDRNSDIIPYAKEEFNRHLGLINAGILLGYQFPLFQVISLDLYVGGLFRVSKYAGEKHLTKYKDWTNFDYTGIIPTAGVRINVLK